MKNVVSVSGGLIVYPICVTTSVGGALSFPPIFTNVFLLFEFFSGYLLSFFSVFALSVYIAAVGTSWVGIVLYYYFCRG